MNKFASCVQYSWTPSKGGLNWLNSSEMAWAVRLNVTTFFSLVSSLAFDSACIDLVVWL